MSFYQPHRWAIVKAVYNGNEIFKVLGSWRGGYLDGDSWRLSSGITGMEDLGKYYSIDNESGSRYDCEKNSYGLSPFSLDIYNSMKQRIDEKNDDRYSLQLLTEKEALEFLQDKSVIKYQHEEVTN